MLSYAMPSKHVKKAVVLEIGREWWCDEYNGKNLHPMYLSVVWLGRSGEA